MCRIANYAVIIGLSMLAACSGKPKLEAPLCPDLTRGGQAINLPGDMPVVSDDGRYTHLRFAPGQEIPNVSALRLDGSERRADYTFDRETNTITVFGIYPTIVLRADGRIACLRNMAYDARSPQARNAIAREDGAVW